MSPWSATAGPGKTSLAEALLFAAGAIPRLGQGRGRLDRLRLRSRGAAAPRSPCRSPRAVRARRSTRSTCSTRPGYADFVGDVVAALQAADLALFVVSAVEGVEVQTEIAWKLAEQRGIPRAIFVNKLDRERASFSRTLDELKEKFGAGVAPLQLPIGEEASLAGVVELLNDVAVHVHRRHAARAPRGRCPPRWRSEEHAVHDALDRRHRRRRRRPHGALPRRREDRDQRARQGARGGRRDARTCSRCCAGARRS